MLEARIVQRIPAIASGGGQGQYRCRAVLCDVQEDRATSSAATSSIRSGTIGPDITIVAIGHDRPVARYPARVDHHQAATDPAFHTGERIVRIAAAAAAAQEQTTERLGQRDPWTASVGPVATASFPPGPTNTTSATIASTTPASVVIIATAATISRGAFAIITTRESVPGRAVVHRIESIPHVARRARDVLTLARGLVVCGRHVQVSQVRAGSCDVLIARAEPTAVRADAVPVEIELPCHIEGDDAATTAVPRRTGQIARQRKVAELRYAHHLEALLCERARAVAVRVGVYRARTTTAATERKRAAGEWNGVRGHEELVAPGIVERRVPRAPKTIRARRGVR